MINNTAKSFDPVSYKTSIKLNFSFLKKSSSLQEAFLNSITITQNKGYLLPICRHNLNDEETIKKLTTWRNENRESFFTQFTATFEGTRKWLEEMIDKKDGRILFLIVDTFGNPVGHIGFDNCINDDGKMEIDSVLRGEKNSSPGIMGQAVLSLIEWAKSKINPKKIILHVFSDNEHAISFYEKIGFRKGQQIFMEKKQAGEKIIYQPAKKETKDGKYVLKMEYDFNEDKRNNSSKQKVQVIETDFETRNKLMIEHMGKSKFLNEQTYKWFLESIRYEYSYHFKWLGRPIIQYPQDILAMQELVWKIQPDLIIETGVARGGSVIFYASLLELIKGDGKVVGIDIDIRPDNRKEIENHPLFKRVVLLEGSSTSQEVLEKVRQLAKGKKRVLVVLDSLHTQEHVMKEIQLYSHFVKKGSYMVVFDTVIEDMPADFFPDRPWGKGNNPKTAVFEFLKNTDRFEIDKEIQNKLQITVAPEGYLKCIKD